MRLVSWNVNGIRAIHKKGFLEWFAAESPDILCIQETKANFGQLSPELTSVAGYRSYFSPQERKGYSGVALYTKEEPKSVSYGLGLERFDSEGRTIAADFGDFVLFDIYFPNGKRSAERLRYKMDFYDAFLERVNALKSEGRHVVVCGDVNTAHKEADLARPKENAKVSGFLPEERALDGTSSLTMATSTRSGPTTRNRAIIPIGTRSPAPGTGTSGGASTTSLLTKACPAG